MLTIEKINIYKKYEGDIDGYVRKVHNNQQEKKVSDEEWSLMNSIVQDIEIIHNNRASQEYIDKFNQKLKDICDNEDTVKELTGLNEYLDNKRHLLLTYLIPIIDFIVQKDQSVILHDESVLGVPLGNPYKKWYIGHAKHVKMDNKFRAMYWNVVSKKSAEIIIKHFTELGMNEVIQEQTENKFEPFGSVFLYDNTGITDKFNFNSKDVLSLT